eukprot:COSAG01_NODE_1953_length_8818_cov_5.158619_8_plen_256_part_00
MRARFRSLLTMRLQHGAAFGRDDFYFVCAMATASESDEAIEIGDTSEIAECRWLPLQEYVDATMAVAAARGVGDTMNSWLMRNVVAQLHGDGGGGGGGGAHGLTPAEWGWGSYQLEAGSGRSAKHVTGWGDRPTFTMFAPRGFQPPRPSPAPGPGPAPGPALADDETATTTAAAAAAAAAAGTTAAEASPFTPPAPGALAAAAASAGLESAAAVDPADAARRSRILALQQQADSDAPSPKEMANFEDSNARLRGD